MSRVHDLVITCNQRCTEYARIYGGTAAHARHACNCNCALPHYQPVFPATETVELLFEDDEEEPAISCECGSTEFYYTRNCNHYFYYTFDTTNMRQTWSGQCDREHNEDVDDTPSVQCRDCARTLPRAMQELIDWDSEP